MTRRQIYFYAPERGVWYVSEEYNGDKTELEAHGSADACSETWPEILERFRPVNSLCGFFEALSYAHACYRSALQTLPGPRVHVLTSRSQLKQKDETWGITPERGLFLDKPLSITAQEESS